MAGNRLAPANVADVFTRLGFHIHPINGHTQQPGTVFTQQRLDRSQCRLLRMNDDVNIDQLKPLDVEPGHLWFAERAPSHRWLG